MFWGDSPLLPDGMKHPFEPALVVLVAMKALPRRRRHAARLDCINKSEPP